MSKMRDIFYSLGKSDAIALRNKAAYLSETEIIAREHSAPAFEPDKDYSEYPVSAPVTDEGQVWLLIQQHNASHYTGRPSTLRALWGLAHTTDPARAKAWVDPHGTSGMYMKDECYKDADGIVHRAKEDNIVHDAVALPEAWETVSEIL